MDILIRGIDSPKETSGIEVFLYNDGTTLCRNIGCDRWTEVEVIELPEHGRLGDLDAMASRIKNGVYPDSMAYTIALGIIERELENTPVVLERTT